MKVWLENRKDQERDFDPTELVKAFIIECNKKESYSFEMLDRALSLFISNWRIEGKIFVWEQDGYKEIKKLYYELRDEK